MVTAEILIVGYLPDSLLSLQVYEDSILLPGHIGNILDCCILDKMPPDDALQRDVGSGVVEFVRRKVLW